MLFHSRLALALVRGKVTRTRACISSIAGAARRSLTDGIVCGVGLVATGLAALTALVCVTGCPAPPPPANGSISVAWSIQSPGGLPMSCEQAGARSAALRLRSRATNTVIATAFPCVSSPGTAQVAPGAYDVSFLLNEADGTLLGTAPDQAGVTIVSGRLTTRLVITAANNRRSTESFESEAAALERKTSFQREIQQLTIAAAVEAYLAAEERRMNEGEIRASSLTRTRYHLRAMLKLDTRGHFDLRKLTATYAERLYGERTGAVDTHRNGLSVAKAFGAWCVKRGWLRANPFADVVGRGRRHKGKRQLRIDESRKVIDTCAARLDHDDGAVCTLAYLLLSTRNGEVVLASVRDVDDGGRLFWVADSKTEAGRRQIEVPVVLQPGLVRLAQGRPADAPLFAHAATRARAQDWAREQVWRICKLAGVPRVGPHGLRGTHASIADTAGATPELVAATLGHASTGITTGGAYIDRNLAAAAARRRTWRILEGGAR